MSFTDIREIEWADHLAIRRSVWEAQLVNGSKPSPYFRWKGLLDRLLAAILLIPGLPIIAVLVLLVRWTSRGSGIYAQTRVGKNGRCIPDDRHRNSGRKADEGRVRQGQPL